MSNTPFPTLAMALAASAFSALAQNPAPSAPEKMDQTEPEGKIERPVPKTPPNILFFAVDDLRCTLGCYGDPVAHTPNIDRLAARGLVFNRAYCQQAVCNASRSSLMTGRRPDTIKVWDLKSHFREELPESWRHLPQFSSGTRFRAARPDVITLPQQFKLHGYEARSIGKIYHGAPGMDDPASWSAPSIFNVTRGVEGKYGLAHNLEPYTTVFTKRDSCESADVPDAAYDDGQVVAVALQTLREIKDRPFFLAVGFRKPHLPFCAPKKYWDLYDRQTIGMPVSPGHPSAAPNFAGHDSPELRGYRDIPKEGPIPPEKIMELRHGYYAAVSYMDAQVGKVLDELDRLGLSDNTIISFYGDHGFHLGEKDLWGKTTNYELDTRAPLIVAAPKQKLRNTACAALTEFVDLYPTLVELAGLPMPDGLEGISLVPLLENPQRPWKTAAFSQFPRPWTYQGEPEVMGYTMRTDRYRYTEWKRFRTGEVLARELYDHNHDANEIANDADNPKNAGLVRELHGQLTLGWKSALPPIKSDRFEEPNKP